MMVSKWIQNEGNVNYRKNGRCGRIILGDGRLLNFTAEVRMGSSDGFIFWTKGFGFKYDSLKKVLKMLLNIKMVLFNYGEN